MPLISEQDPKSIPESESQGVALPVVISCNTRLQGLTLPLTTAKRPKCKRQNFAASRLLCPLPLMERPHSNRQNARKT